MDKQASKPPRKQPGKTMNNFTPRAQQVLEFARKEAKRFNHHYVGSEHILLGIIKLGQGVAVNVLQKMGLDLKTIRIQVEKQLGSGPETQMVRGIPYTPSTKKILKLADEEAKALKHAYVGSEHILLGLLIEGEGVAASVLKNLEVDIERTRNESCTNSILTWIRRKPCAGIARLPSKAMRVRNAASATAMPMALMSRRTSEKPCAGIVNQPSRGMRRRSSTSVFATRRARVSKNHSSKPISGSTWQPLRGTKMRQSSVTSWKTRCLSLIFLTRNACPLSS